MKRTLKSIALSLAILTGASTLSGCVSNTNYGPCVGAFDEKNPNLEYKLSGRNLFMAVFFSGLIVPPIVVVVDETFCPVGQKTSK